MVTKQEGFTVSGGYTADDIQHLEGLDAVRKRPGMYIGDTDSKGLSHLVYEIVDNSVDEALAGYCTRIDVTIDNDNTVTVTDNGRGIPTGINTKTKLSGVALAFTKLHAGGKFGGSGYKSAGGLHGVGAAVTNALSEMCIVEVRRDAKIHRIEFSRGIIGEFDSTGKFTPTKTDLKVIGKSPKADTGTTVTFRPDAAVFTPGAAIDIDLVRERLRRTAFLVPGLAIALTANGETTEYRFEGGIRDLAEASATGAPLCPVIDINGVNTFTETVPVLQEDGSLKNAEVEREVEVRVAVAPTLDYDTNIASFVNIVNTSLGGTHVKGFEAGLLKWARTNATLKAKDPALVLADCLEGITAVISVGLPEPQFTSQDKQVLGTKPAQHIVADVVFDGLTAWMNGRGNKQAAKTLLDKIVTAARVRVATKEQRDTQRRKTALENSTLLPAKLVDCRSRDDSELFIVEGDSALGTAKSARYASHQALLPVRGKILNVRKASLKAALGNAEVSAIIQCLGTGIGKDYNVENRRYDRVILMSDADADGHSINLLCIVLFWSLMPEWVKDGRLFVAMPPLFTVNTRGRGGEKLFAVDSAELEEVTAGLDARGISYDVRRNKGLGEQSADELKATTMAPDTRKLKRIQVADAERLSGALDLFMGTDVAPRRDWIFENLELGDADA